MSQKNSQPCSYLRFFHAIADPYAIYDVYIDDKLSHSYMLFQDFTNYQPITVGLHHIVIKIHNTEIILCEKKMTLTKDHIFTYILAATPHSLKPFHLYAIEDSFRPYAKDFCFGRFAHFSKNLSALQIATSEEKILQSHLSFGNLGAYLPLKPHEIHLNFTLKASREPLFTALYKTLKPYRFYTFYILDKLHTESEATLVLSIDGNSFLTFANKSQPPV
jgi:hypothetical protein